MYPRMRMHVRSFFAYVQSERYQYINQYMHPSKKQIKQLLSIYAARLKILIFTSIRQDFIVRAH